MGTLLHSCTEVREPIDLSFGVVSGVSQGIGVHMLQSFNGSQWRIFAQKCI